MPSLVWVIELLEYGRKPNIRLILKSSKETWKQDEKQVLNFYRQEGHALLNVHAGGDGPEDGSIKEFCGTCGGRKKQLPGGGRHCPKCHAAWFKTETGKASGRRKMKQRRMKSKQKSIDNAQCRDYMSRFRKTEHGKAYKRDWQKAKRRGLTVAQYRTQVQI